MDFEELRELLLERLIEEALDGGELPKEPEIYVPIHYGSIYAEMYFSRKEIMDEVKQAEKLLKSIQL